jgi:hypothetical protein
MTADHQPPPRRFTAYRTLLTLLALLGPAAPAAAEPSTEPAAEPLARLVLASTWPEKLDVEVGGILANRFVLSAGTVTGVIAAKPGSLALAAGPAGDLGKGSFDLAGGRFYCLVAHPDPLPAFAGAAAPEVDEKPDFAAPAGTPRLKWLLLEVPVEPAAAKHTLRVIALAAGPLAMELNGEAIAAAPGAFSQPLAFDDQAILTQAGRGQPLARLAFEGRGGGTPHFALVFPGPDGTPQAAAFHAPRPQP